MDCGAACLQMVTKFHGKYFSLDYLRELTYVNRDGVSLLGISEAAEQIGLKTLAAAIPYDRMATDVPLPAIAHWDNNHFVTVFEANSRFVWVGDPATRLKKLSKQEFLSHWASRSNNSGVLLFLETTPKFEQGEGSKEKQGLEYLYYYILKYKSQLLQVLLGVVAAIIIQAIFPFLIQSLIDVGVENKQRNFIWLVLVAQLILFFTRFLVEWFRGLLVLHIGIRVNLHLVSDFMMKLTRMPLKYFDAHYEADVLQRIYDNDRVERLLTSQSIHALFSLVSIVVFGIILAIFSFKIFAIFSIGVIVYGLWMYYCYHNRKKMQDRRFEYAIDSHNALSQLVKGMKDIKLHNLAKSKRWTWESARAKLYNTQTKFFELNQRQRLIASLINESKNIFITIVAAYAVVNNEFSLGVLVAILYIIGQLNGPMEQLVQFFTMYQEAKISIERMNEIHLREEEEDLMNKLDVLPFDKDIAFEKVSFRYNGPNSPIVLKEINFKIPYGKTTAIVGTSGSGKSTILKLLLGFYPPTDGAITVGDVKLDNIQSNLWRRHCSAVLQDSHIFSDTIENNIALAEEGQGNTHRILEAATLANIHRFIDKKLPLSYKTQIGQNGTGLSQGQKQSILIARAIYKDFDYLFLDEATNALDSYSEMMVMENILERFHGKTFVIIAHRLNTIINADNIIVLEEGEVIEQGTHQELYHAGGRYSQMIRNQMELSV